MQEKELVERIRAICLVREVIEKPHRRVELNVLCEQLVAFIHSPAEFNAIFDQLPQIAGEIVETKCINSWVDSIISMPTLLDILVRYSARQEQIIAASESKLATIIRREDDLINVLEVLHNNPQAQKTLLATLDLITIIRGGEKLGLVLKQLEFSSSLKAMLINRIESKLGDLLKSEEILYTMLKNLNGEDELHLQKIIINEFSPHIKSWKELKHTLKLLSGNLEQEELINTLNGSGRLASLKGTNKDKKSIFKILNDPVLQEIVNKPFVSEPWLLSTFKSKSQFFVGVDNPTYDASDERPSLRGR